MKLINHRLTCRTFDTKLGTPMFKRVEKKVPLSISDEVWELLRKVGTISPKTESKEIETNMLLEHTYYSGYNYYENGI